jgi:hypothetical protein
MPMSKYKLPVMVSFFFLAAVVSVSATAVDVSIDPEVQTVQPNSQVIFNMTITNNQANDDIFQIYMSGDHVEWYMPSVLTKAVKAASSQQVELLFNPPNVRGRFPFKAFAASVINPDTKGSADLVIDIPYDFIIRSFSYALSGSAVNFASAIWAPEEKAIEGAFYLKDGSGKALGTVPFKETISGEKTITRSLVLKDALLAGNYTAVISIGNESKSYTFQIKAVHSMLQTVQETVNGLEKQVTITISNDGNVIERNYVFQQETPIDPMTGLMTKPGSNCQEKDGTMVCNYVIGEIGPGATAQVSYVVSSWPAMNGYIILVIIIGGLLVFSFLKVTTPTITKHHSRKGDDKHNISIHVKNPFFHNLSDVVVRDQVSPLAQVLHEEIESTVPVIRKQEDGSTELLWKLGEMKPREERVLQYKVRSLVNGHIKMPAAHMKFTTTGKSDKKIKLVSNGITLS